MTGENSPSGSWETVFDTSEEAGNKSISRSRARACCTKAGTASRLSIRSISAAVRKYGACAYTKSAASEMAAMSMPPDAKSQP